MGNYCPYTNGNVVYLKCQECEDKICKCDGGPVRYGQDLRCFQEGSGTGQKPEGSREGDFLQENLLGFD